MIDKEEARRFAKARDANFDKAASEAEAAFKKEFNVKAILQSPDKYLPLLFIKLGSQVVKKMIGKAKETGKEHAERLVKTRNSDAEV